MILDIIIIILLIIYVLIGRKRGFVLEFINLYYKTYIRNYKNQ